MRLATNRPNWMTVAPLNKVVASNICSPMKFASSAADSPPSPKRARLSWMEDVSVNIDSGGASSNGSSQGQVSVLDELFTGSQVYEATTLLETGDGSMQLSHFGDGFSVKSASSNDMKSPASPPIKMGAAVETAAAAAAGTPMASAQPQHSSDQSMAATTAATAAGMPTASVPPQPYGDCKPASVEAETAAGMPNSSVPPQPDEDHHTLFLEAETAAGMPNSSVPTECDGGHNPASATAETAAATETAQQTQVPLTASVFSKQVIQPKLDDEQVVDMGSYLADAAPKRLKVIKQAFSWHYLRSLKD